MIRPLFLAIAGLVLSAVPALADGVLDGHARRGAVTKGN